MLGKVTNIVIKMDDGTPWKEATKMTVDSINESLQKMKFSPLSTEEEKDIKKEISDSMSVDEEYETSTLNEQQDQDTF